MAQNETSQQTAAVAPQEKKQLTTKDYFNQDGVKAKLFEILGKKAPGFITGVLQTVASNEKLRKADPSTIYQAAAIAAVLDLPINNSLGKAYIVPYNETREDEQNRKYTVCVAQFQMGYKGFIELAIRSSNFKTINVTDVKEGEILAHDRLTGNIDWAWINNPKDRDKLPTIAYVAYIETNSGFRKSMLMYKEEIEKHGKRYSKTYTFYIKYIYNLTKLFLQK